MTSWSELQDLASNRRRKVRSDAPKPRCQKKAYPSKRKAVGAARVMRQAGERLHPYFCKSCQAYHLGHAQLGRRASRARKRAHG